MRSPYNALLALLAAARPTDAGTPANARANVAGYDESYDEPCEPLRAVASHPAPRLTRRTPLYRLVRRRCGTAVLLRPLLRRAVLV